MPYVPKKQPPFSRMARLLRGYGFNGNNLCDILSVSPPTARAKIEDPTRLTLGDLDKLRRSGHIPWDEIKEALVR